MNRASTLLSRRDSFLVVVRRSGVMVGLACWRKLPEESEVFGFAVGRLEFMLTDGDYVQSRAIVAELLDGVFNGLHANGIRCLTAQTDPEDLAALHGLEEAGFRIVEGNLVFGISPHSTEAHRVNDRFESRVSTEADLPDILAIAGDCAIDERFGDSSVLGSELASKLKCRCARAACACADAIVVAENANQIVAYATCQIDAATSSLLGIRYGKIETAGCRPERRREGAATCALTSALEWFRERNVDLVEGYSQLRNLDANRVLENKGFRMTASHLILRKLLA
ncbi:MAG: GNAT family N-acetyltransferase [Acidobacteriaceae bacterium]|nr:GNAT family N-acetyltransferase [Acidobacteriaceae bacterium]